MTALVVAAHPDDELLGCGGTIASLAAAGTSCHIVILGEGLSSRYDARQDVDSTILAQLHRDANEVAKLLGAGSVRIVGLPDNRFDEVSLLTVAKHVERAVAEFEPDTIYTHHPGDLNIDHGV